MKSLKSFLLICIILTALVSCTTENKKLSEKIQKMEKEMMTPGGSLDKTKADDLVRNYESFAAQFPKDTLTPRYLQKAGDISMNSGKPMRAIEFFDRVINEYPDYRKAPECLFMKAFVYETLLNDLDKARETYIAFIKKYPTNDFADDAQAMLNNLGKTPEELMKEFESKNR